MVLRWGRVRLVAVREKGRVQMETNGIGPRGGVQLVVSECPVVTDNGI